MRQYRPEIAKSLDPTTVLLCLLLIRIYIKIMEIEIFTLCDFAQDNNQKLTIVGTFDTIQPPAYPHTHSLSSVACRMRFTGNEQGEYGLEIKILTKEGAPLIPPVNRGMYAIELHLNGEWKTGMTLILR